MIYKLLDITVNSMKVQSLCNESVFPLYSKCGDRLENRGLS